MADVSLSSVALSPLALHFLARRGIYTVDQLCRTSPQELLFQPRWLTPAERWERQRLAGLVMRDIQIRLAERGLALRGHRFAVWVNEPIEKLQLPPRVSSLVRRFRINTVGELLARTVDDLLSTSFSLTAVGEIMRALVACGLHLSDGRPCGPDDLTL